MGNNRNASNNRNSRNNKNRNSKNTRRTNNQTKNINARKNVNTRNNVNNINRNKAAAAKKAAINKRKAEQIKQIQKQNKEKQKQIKKQLKKQKKELERQENIKRAEFERLSIPRIVICILVVLLMFGIIIRQIVKIQFVDGEKYKQRAYMQSTASQIINSKRGIIYDANKKALAISSKVDTVSVSPRNIVKMKDGKNVDEEKTREVKEKLAHKFSELFELEYDEVLAKLMKRSYFEVIASKVESDKINDLRKWLSANSMTNFVRIDEDSKRFYPYNNLASNVIGFCGANNQGLEGIEYSYNDKLKGVDGKRVTAISMKRDAIPDQKEEYIAPENGSNVYLTIDSNIQVIAEKYLKQAVEENNCEYGGNLIIMDPQNGEIKAMATYPDYNLNEPYIPNDNLKKIWDKLSDQEKSNQLFKMWRNRAVLDSYEPGSTFKVITSSIALEENLVTTDKPGDFHCTGVQRVNDMNIRCASRYGHGSESLRNALENSCNPAMIQLGQRIGKQRFYRYLKAFKLMDKTGVDLPSEGNSNFWNLDDVGPVELATMSFGQRFTITPLQLVRAVSTIANEGKLVTPHLVKAIENADTGIIKEVEYEEGDQVISKETADKVKDMMKSVVENGGGRYAKLDSYVIGGKTGTSEPDPNHKENGYVASFIAIAPLENTKVTVLLTLYKPRTSNHYGGHIAAPVVSQVLKQVLPYLEIPADNDRTGNNKNTDNSNYITVPNVKNKKLSDAKSQLENLGLVVKTSGLADDIIKKQVPAPGTRLEKRNIIRVYANDKEKVTTTVPDLKNATLEQAKIMLKAKNLNYNDTGNGIVISQSKQPDTEVEEGTVIDIMLQEKTRDTQH